MIEVSPPVGTYNDPRCALELLKRTTGVKKSSFGSTAVRFPCDHRRSSTPGQDVCVLSVYVCVCVWLAIVQSFFFF